MNIEFTKEAVSDLARLFRWSIDGIKITFKNDKVLYMFVCKFFYQKKIYALSRDGDGWWFRFWIFHIRYSLFDAISYDREHECPKKKWFFYYG